MTKVIGLTGGIGSGKTTVASFFKQKNIPVYIADEEAKKISNSKKIIQKIKKTFGNEVIENGEINRKALGNIVFQDKEKLKKLNQIIHPEVNQHFKKWLKKMNNFSYVIKESAILFESGSYIDCDIIIVVTAPLEERIMRTMQRDGTTKETVLQRISNQISDEEKISKADFVIHNINLENTFIQVENVLKKLK